MSLRHLTWTDELTVGQRGFDRDHRAMAELLNEILVAADGQASPGVLAALLHNLTVATETHFIKEEAYLRRIDFPDTEAHAAEHKRLMVEIRLLERGLAGGAVTLDEKTADFLRHWLVDHVVEFDKAYTRWERERKI